MTREERMLLLRFVLSDVIHWIKDLERAAKTYTMPNLIKETEERLEIAIEAQKLLVKFKRVPDCSDEVFNYINANMQPHKMILWGFKTEFYKELIEIIKKRLLVRQGVPEIIFEL